MSDGDENADAEDAPDEETDAPVEDDAASEDAAADDAGESTGEDGEAAADDEDGTKDEADDSAEDAAAPATDVSAEELEARLDEAEADLEAAETEADLDAVEADLDAIEADLEAAELPEPEEDEEDAEGPREELESRLSDVRDALEEARGPYAEDVVAEIETARETLTAAEWTDDGENEALDVVETFLESAGETLGETFAFDGESVEAAADALDEVVAAVEAAGLDPDEDEETIAALLDATDDLQNGLDDAEEWDDLTVVEQLRAQGFYDRLSSENRKDFPPERGVVRIAQREHDPERVLMALEYLESDFMEEEAIGALKRMGAPEAVDAVLERAQKRDQDAIETLGKIGDEEAADTLHEFIDGDGNPVLQKVTLKALGEIGSEASTQPVADRLVAGDDEVRSQAARALGGIGDPRAIEPLSDVLDDDDAETVRASAAWALVTIGTRGALEEAADYTDDRSYVVQVEAEKAADALDAEATPA
jgi:hypothetical protein